MADFKDPLPVDPALYLHYRKPYDKLLRDVFDTWLYGIVISNSYPQEPEMQKTIKYKLLHNGAIVELSFVVLPRKDYFKENITPAIAILKQLVPMNMRTYQPATYKWEIASEYIKVVRDALEALQFKFIEAPKTPEELAAERAAKEAAFNENFYYNTTPATTVESTESIASKLSQYLGVPITTQELTELKKLYRQKARELHPDFNGGDGSKMSELNRLWTLYTTTGVN